MSAHHNIKSHDAKDKCLYCGTQLEMKKWQSKHYVDKHYKINICPACSKEAKMEVDFLSSGHDSWASPVTLISTQKPKTKIVFLESPLERVIKGG